MASSPAHREALLRGARFTFDLSGRVIVVTGAGSGIGSGVAVGLAGMGANVVAADVDAQGLEDTMSIAADAGLKIATVHCDVSAEQSVIDAFEQVVADHGVPDALFANAGIGGPVVPVDELSFDQWRHTMAVNLDGAFLTARQAYRKMRPRGSGKIVLTTSVWGVRGTIDGPFTAYAASKGGVWNLVHQLAVDMAEGGVTVNGIAPAGFHTSVADGFYDNNPSAVESLRSQIPSGKIVRPDAMVGPAAFLASSGSDHVNGHVLAVDGGYLAK